MNPFKCAIETLVIEREKERAAVREIDREFDKSPNEHHANASKEREANIAQLDDAIRILQQEAQERFDASIEEADRVPF